MKIMDFTILVVEDDPDHVLLLQMAFRKAHLANPVKFVRDGEEAIDYLSGSGAYGDRKRFPVPSLVLLDLKLPKKSGLEVLEWMRQVPALAAVPVIILTSSSEPADRAAAQRLGVESYLVKPVGFEGLLEIVKSLGMYWMVLSKAPGA